MEKSTKEKFQSKTTTAVYSWDNLHSKEEVSLCYQGYINRLLDGIKRIESISAKNSKFERIRLDSLGNIKQLLEDSRNQMEQVINETIWDRLVIAFFGETNAGKSTIIEAFRVKFNDPSRIAAIQQNGGKGVDGLIVGDGRQDFTQIYEKYNLEIDGCPFVLIDVPGIEGKEANYLDEILSALKQAHCVFYVQGHNKKPDSATAEKIKGFLSEWVDVYSIYNVRGGVSNYDEVEERYSLITPSVEKTQESIKEVFNNVLPIVYKGNVTLQGYLALMSVASFHASRTDLLSAQAKILDFFGSRAEVESFSRFCFITDLVKSQAKDFSRHILEANKQKLQSLFNRIRKGIDDTFIIQTGKLDKLLPQLDSFKKTVSSAKNKSVFLLNSKLNSELKQVLAALKEAADDIIDTGESEEEWFSRISDMFSLIIWSFEDTVKEVFTKSCSNFKHKVEEKRKDLDRIIYHTIRIPSISIEVGIDLSDVINALKFSIKDDLIKGFFKAFFSPISSLIKVFTETVDGRDKAKRLIAAKLVDAEYSIRNQIDDKASIIKDYLKKEAESIENSIDAEIKNIADLKRDLKNLQNMFKE